MDYFHTIEFYWDNVPLMDRDNIAIIVFLLPYHPTQSKKGPICITNTHLLFNPKRGDIKLTQLAHMFAEVDDLCWCSEPLNSNVYNNNYTHTIMCGDFNSLPFSPLYNFITTQKLQFEGLSRNVVSGQAEGLSSRNFHRFGAELLPVEMKINNNCQWVSTYERRKKLLEERRLAGKKSFEERSDHDDSNHSVVDMCVSSYDSDSEGETGRKEELLQYKDDERNQEEPCAAASGEEEVRRVFDAHYDAHFSKTLSSKFEAKRGEVVSNACREPTTPRRAHVPIRIRRPPQHEAKTHSLEESKSNRRTSGKLSTQIKRKTSDGPQSVPDLIIIEESTDDDVVASTSAHNVNAKMRRMKNNKMERNYEDTKMITNTTERNSSIHVHGGRISTDINQNACLSHETNTAVDGTSQQKQQQQKIQHRDSNVSGEHERSEGVLTHNFSLQSSYCHFNVDKTREVTTCHDRDASNVDYIFYSSRCPAWEPQAPWDRNERLSVSAVLSLLPERTLNHMGKLPNRLLSSDHQMLATSFILS